MRFARRVSVVSLLACLVASALPAPGAAQEGEAPSARREVLLAAALASNPELTMRRAEADARRAEAVSEGALPAPELAVQMWNVPFVRPYALDQAAMWMVEFRQAFPVAAARSQRSRARLAEARAATESLRDVAADLAMRIATAHAEYVEAVLARDVARETLARLDDLAAATLAQSRVGAVGLDAPLRIDAMRAELRREEVHAQLRVDATRSAINALLGRAPSAPLAEPTDLRAAPYAIDVDAFRRALAGRPDRAAAEARVEAATRLARAARIESRRPSFEAGVSVFEMPGLPIGYGGMVTMSLPWFTRGSSAVARAAGFERSRAEAEAELVERTARVEIETALGRLAATEHMLRSIEAELVVPRERVFAAMRPSYLAGGTSLASLVEALLPLVAARREEAQARLEYLMALAALERATGVLVDTAGDGSEAGE